MTPLRLSLGILFVAHGLLKGVVFTLPGTAQFFASVGFLGVLVTPVALALFLILLVATFNVHGAHGWIFSNTGGGWEFPAFFAIAASIFSHPKVNFSTFGLLEF